MRKSLERVIEENKTGAMIVDILDDALMLKIYY